MKIIIFIVFLVSVFLIRPAEAIENLPHHNLSVSFDIQRNLIKGVSTISLPENSEVKIYIGSLKILSAKQNAQPFKPDLKDGIFRVKGKAVIELVYEGFFKGEYEKQTIENIGVVSGNLIGERGIYLTEGWYPAIVGIDSYREGMAYYSLKANIPKWFAAVSEADEIQVIDQQDGKEYSFLFSHPLQQIHLTAGSYIEKKETFHGIDIYGYFFPEDIALAETYIEYTKKYIAMYGELLNPYPFKRFSIVENFLPTGYSMPTFTLLGQDVVRLPFIVETSLGHEVLHQWFGNFIYCKCEEGNWLEGLTTYLSDYLYEEQKGKGAEYRKKVLVDYQSYVSPDKEISLKNFFGRKDFGSKAIGYGKGAMLFHMLKNLIGNDSFNNALKGLIKEKEFQETSWDDLKTAFEKSSGANLDLFFDQWLTRKGLISIKIEEPGVVFSHDSQTLSFEVVQQSEPYAFNLPVKIITNKGEKMEVLNIEKEREKIKIQVEGTPLEMTFDGDYNLMRSLSEAEYPPVIAKLIGDEKRLIVLPEKDREKYVELIALLKEEGFTIKEEKEIKDEDIKTSSLLILGTGSPILKRLFGEFKGSGTGFTLLMKKNPLNSSKVIAIASADSKEEVDLASKKIFHYGKYSYLRFEKGQNIEKKIDETEQGIRINLYKPVLGIQPRDAIKLDEIIQKISGTPIIYVGERHTNYEEHKIQLDIIMSLYEKGKKFAIGMEMFQRPFQKVLDDYISGTISEKEFLKNSEYFKRWQFDYNLYREITEFAKAKNIPIIALNLRSEIIEKVSRGGLDSLTEEERKEIPEDMDMTDEDYKNRLKEIFGQHEKSESKNFDYFYQSQILWDETMAHSINEFLKERPDHQMIVLAGVGHIMHSSGIPKRVFRLNARDYVTVIPNVEELDKDLGHFVLFPEPIPLPPSLKLGVILKEVDGKVMIVDIQPDGVAWTAGIKKDDILISIDDWKIETVEDVKIFLVDKKKGETIKIKALRKRFLLGDKEMEFTATL